MFTKTRKNLDRNRGVCYNDRWSRGICPIPAGVFPTSVNLLGLCESRGSFRGGCFLGALCPRKSKYLFLPWCLHEARREVMMMEYVTYDDLIKIAMLIIAIISCYLQYKDQNNRKR